MEEKNGPNVLPMIVVILLLLLLLAFDMLKLSNMLGMLVGESTSERTNERASLRARASFYVHIRNVT